MVLRHAFVALALVACTIAPKKDDDTIASCNSDGDCQLSKHCLAGYCETQDCEKRSCPDGWDCKSYSGSLFFSGGAVCELRCTGAGNLHSGARLRGSCPQGFACAETYCDYDPTAAIGEPTVKIEPEHASIEAGKPLSLRAVATSPNGDIATYRWELGDNTSALTAEVTHAYDSSHTAYSGSVTITDSVGATAYAPFYVEMCVGAGASCSDGTHPGCCPGLGCNAGKCSEMRESRNRPVGNRL
jgi:hypothetical protein